MEFPSPSFFYSFSHLSLSSSQLQLGVPSHLHVQDVLPGNLRTLKLKVPGAATSSTARGRVGVEEFRGKVTPTPGIRNGVSDPLGFAP